MGALTDIFAATDAEAASLSLEQIPIQVFPGIEAKHWDPIKFGTLQNILLGTGVQDAIRQQEMVREASEDGPWITRIPPPLFDAIAGMDEERIKEVAERWRRTEEYKLDRWALSDVRH